MYTLLNFVKLLHENLSFVKIQTVIINTFNIVIIVDLQLMYLSKNYYTYDEKLLCIYVK